MTVAYTTPFTAVAGTAWKAADWNTYGRDNIAWLATDSPACRAYNSATISHATSGVAQAVTLDSERYDNATLHSTSSNTSRFTAPTGGGGKYLMGGQLGFAASAGGTFRQNALRINGATLVIVSSAASSAGLAPTINISTVYSLAAADYMEMVGNQDSGGALNMGAASAYQPEAWLYWFRN